MKQKLGLTHIYCGDGKGKTTAAMGLALRAVGSGFKVVIVQFLKDGKSSEISVLNSFSNVKIIVNTELTGFTFQMSSEQKADCKTFHNSQFLQAIELCNSGECDLLILDESIGAINSDVLDANLVLNFLRDRSKQIEVVLTGRNPQQELVDIADYVSEIVKIKHPFDNGIGARIGIEK